MSSFPIAGHITSMGNVNGSFYLMHTFVPFRKLPDLSKSSLVLANQKGSVAIGLNASRSHHYKFKIMSGTGIYTFASGVGNLTISASAQLSRFQHQDPIEQPLENHRLRSKLASSLLSLPGIATPAHVNRPGTTGLNGTDQCSSTRPY